MGWGANRKFLGEESQLMNWRGRRLEIENHHLRVTTGTTESSRNHQQMRTQWVRTAGWQDAKKQSSRHHHWRSHHSLANEETSRCQAIPMWHASLLQKKTKPKTKQHKPEYDEETIQQVVCMCWKSEVHSGKDLPRLLKISMSRETEEKKKPNQKPVKRTPRDLLAKVRRLSLIGFQVWRIIASPGTSREIWTSVMVSD